MNSYSFLRKEQRELEKTPLIDIIFLLLIFFFVSLTTQNYDRREEFSKGRKTSQKLLRMAHAGVLADSAYVLVQARMLTPEMLGNMRSMATTLRRIRTDLGLPIPPELRPTTLDGLEGALTAGQSIPMVLPKSLSVLAGEISALRADMDHAILPEHPNIANELADAFPKRMGPGVVAQLADYFHNYENRLLTEQNVELHLRIDKDVPMKVFQTFYQLADALNISYKHLHIRVLQRPE